MKNILVMFACLCACFPAMAGTDAATPEKAARFMPLSVPHVTRPFAYQARPVKPLATHPKEKLEPVRSTAPSSMTQEQAKLLLSIYPAHD